MRPDDNTRFEFLCKAAGFEKPTDLPVWKWECQEALSQPYRLLIDLAVPHAHVQNRPYQKLLGARGTFRVMNSAQTPWNQWQGLITAVHMAGVESVQTNDRETSLYLYLKVELEPQFVLLRQETTSRVHVLPEQDNVRQLSMLIRNAMKRADLRTERMLGMPRDGNPDDHADYAIALGSRTDSWQGKDFFFQYKETTLDFLSRHLEHRGAYYRFDQSDSDKETILFCDDTTGLPPDEDIEQANWQAKASLIPNGRAGFLHHFAQHHAISPRTISIDEFNPNDTKLKLQLSKQVNEDATTSPENPYASWGSLNLSGDGYRKQSDGETLLEHYRQEQICRQNQYQAKGLIRDLHAGSVFELQGHALPEFNQQYLVTRIAYRGEQPLPYDTKTETSARLWSEFSVLPADIAFRPERLTPRPHISGLLHAIVEAEDQSNSPKDESLKDDALIAEIDKQLDIAKKPLRDKAKEIADVEKSLAYARSEYNAACEKAKTSTGNARKEAGNRASYASMEVRDLENKLKALQAQAKTLSNDPALQAKLEALNTEKRKQALKRDAELNSMRAKAEKAGKDLEEAKEKQKALEAIPHPQPSQKAELEAQKQKVEALKENKKTQDEALEKRTAEKSADAPWDAWQDKNKSKVSGSNDPNESWVKPYLSKDGYYRVRFLCTDNATDLPENRTAKNSAWVRMATPYAGTTSNQDGEFGMYFPLKAGTEVLVAFMDGDPDEPVIVASVPNSAHRSLASYEEKKKNTSGFVMPGGNMLTFVNKEANKTALLFSPIADSFMLLGGDLDVPGHQGILIHSQGHITTTADSEKKMVEGKGFSRAYDLNVGSAVKAAAKAATPEKNAVEKKKKFEADWLHPDSAASFTISKPKVNFGLDINPLNIDIGGSVGVNFSAKFGVNLAIKASANFSVELTTGKSINLLERQKTEKKSELKIQSREVMAIDDKLTAGTLTETALTHIGRYGVYSASTKAIHRIEAVDGILLTAVSKLGTDPDDEVSKGTLGEKATPTLASVILDAINPLKLAQGLKKNIEKLRKKELADLPAAKLTEVVQNADKAKLRSQDDSYLVLTQGGLTLGSKNTVNVTGKEGLLSFKEDARLASNNISLKSGSTRLGMDKDGAALTAAGSGEITLKVGSNSMNVTPSGVAVKTSGTFTCNGQVIKLG